MDNALEHAQKEPTTKIKFAQNVSLNALIVSINKPVWNVFKASNSRTPFVFNSVQLGTSLLILNVFNVNQNVRAANLPQRAHLAKTPMFSVTVNASLYALKAFSIVMEDAKNVDLTASHAITLVYA